MFTVGKPLKYKKYKEENKGHDPVIKTEPLLTCLEYFLPRAFSRSIDNPGIIPADRVSRPDFSTHCCIRSGQKEMKEVERILYSL